MKNLTVRDAEPKDSKNYAEWLAAAAGINLVDPAVYQYPTCVSAVVEKNGEPILMNSFHLVLTMEALAPKPGLSPMDEARALKQLFEEIKRVAATSGVREIAFMCKDPRVIEFVQRHGWELVNHPVLRFKL